MVLNQLQVIMNKKLFLCFIVLLTFNVFLLAEHETYYVNHTKMPSLTIIKEANIKDNRYEYSIENEYGTEICKAKEASLNFRSVREFIASEEAYSQADKIRITWNFKEDDGTNVDDDIYILKLKEINRKNQSKSITYMYNIVLDSKSPIIQPSLSASNVYKNRKDFISILMDNNSEKANKWQVILDNKHVLYESNLSENESLFFPSGVGISFDDYRTLAEGPHMITVIAKDCAGNTTEELLPFDVSLYPLQLSIFSSSDGITYNLDNTIKPFRFVGTGISGTYWTAIIKDILGNTHFSQYHDSAFDVTCPPFIWDGISSLTGNKSPEGTYVAEIVCRDSAGNELSGSTLFYIGKEKVIDENYGKPPFILGEYKNNEFILNLKNYTETISEANLTVKNNDQILYESPIADINNILWDGIDFQGNNILSTGEIYTFILQVTDSNQQTTDYETSIMTPLIYGDKVQFRQRIKVDSIYFDANDSNIFSDNGYFLKNSKSLRCLVTALKLQMNDNDILVVAGNANYTTFPYTNLMLKEKYELIELSKKRAEIVKKILVFYGLPEDKIVVIANGGDNYEVEPNSLENWKNRRVEFFIETKEE